LHGLETEDELMARKVEWSTKRCRTYVPKITTETPQGCVIKGKKAQCAKKHRGHPNQKRRVKNGWE